MKLPAGSIKKWADLKKLFLARFFKDDTEIFVPTLLAIKQKKGVDQDVYGEISEYGAPISKRHDPIYIGRDLSLQYAKNTPSSNRSG